MIWQDGEPMWAIDIQEPESQSVFRRGSIVGFYDIEAFAH